MTLVIRCSSLDRVMACAGSLAPTDHPYNPESDEAREGTAAHEALGAVVSGLEPDLDAIAGHYSVERDILYQLVARGRLAWAELQKYFRDPIAERAMEADIGPGIMLTGHADVASVAPGHVAVLDWKAGWRPSDHPHQLRGYGRLGAALAGELVDFGGRALAIEVHLRAGTWRVHYWSAEDLEAWTTQLLEQAARVGKQWGPGPEACRYCPLQLTCQARADYIRGAVTAIAPIAGDRYPAERSLIAGLWPQARELRRALDRYDKLVDAFLMDGPLDLGDGRQLELLGEERERLRPSKAMRYLREVLELKPDEADQVLKISKGKLGDVLKARVARGRGAAAIRQAMAELDAAGAIDRYIHLEKRETRKE